MKKIFVSAALILTGLHAMPQSSFTVKEAIDYALQNSVDVKNATLDREATDDQAKAEHGRLMPQIDAGVDYLHNFNVQKIILENGVIPAFTSPEVPYGTVEAFQLQLDNVLTGSITLNQVIFDAALFAGLKSEDEVKQLSAQQITRTRIDVAEQVSKAYYGVLVAQRQSEFLINNLARMDSLYRETQARVKSGISRQIDLDRIEVQFNNLKEERKKAQQLIDLSYALLRFHMNIPQTEQLVLTDSLDERSLEQALSAAAAYDYTRRIEYSILSTQKQIETSGLQMMRAGNIPKLHAFATTGYNPAATRFGDLFQGSRYYNYTFVGLKLSVPVFHGFARKHDLMASHIRLEKIGNSMAQVQRRIDLQVEQSRINLSNNLESLKTQRRNLELAEENVRVIRIENEKGIATNVEVTNAEADLKEAQTHYYNTLYQALLSKIDLEKATGVLLE
jgi:outer membrane protein TolC